jgi:hypothetical protein
MPEVKVSYRRGLCRLLADGKRIVMGFCYCMLAKALPIAKRSFPQKVRPFLLRELCPFIPKTAQLTLSAPKDGFLWVRGRFLGSVLLGLVKKCPTRGAL